MSEQIRAMLRWLLNEDAIDDLIGYLILLKLQYAKENDE